MFCCCWCLQLVQLIHSFDVVHSFEFRGIKKLPGAPQKKKREAKRRRGSRHHNYRKINFKVSSQKMKFNVGRYYRWNIKFDFFLCSYNKTITIKTRYLLGRSCRETSTNHLNLPLLLAFVSPYMRFIPIPNLLGNPQGITYKIYMLRGEGLASLLCELCR